MKWKVKLVGFALPLVVASGGVCPNAAAQGPATPIIVDTAVPIIVKVLKPKPKMNGLVKFEGLIMNANIAQITMRDKKDERSIQTFSLTVEASTKMQQVVDKGGYQYGDKVTVYYDPSTRKAFKFKGKPSKPI